MEKDEVAFYWTGKLQSINRKLKARAIRKGTKWIGTMYESSEFKTFCSSLAAVFMGGPHLNGYVDMQITICASRKADTANFEKAIGDTLEKCGILENDKFIRNVNFIRHYHPISGSKNKYNDALLIELQKIAEVDQVVSIYQQNHDVFKLRK